VNEQKNILVIHTDQQRYDSLGCTGNAFARTPNIDRLAAEGTCCTRHIVSNTICMPSRASLLTGLHVPAHGVWTNGVALGRRDYVSFNPHRYGDNIVTQPPTLADVCAENGYQTAAFGKLHLTPFLSPPEYGYHESQQLWARDAERLDEWHGPYYGFQHVDMAFTHFQVSTGHHRLWLMRNRPDLVREAEQGVPDRPIPALPDLFPAVVPLELHPTMWLADRFVSYLDARRLDRPFCAFIGFPDPHHPFVPTREALDVFDALDAPGPAWPAREPADAADRAFNTVGTVLTDFTVDQKKLIVRYTLAMIYQIDLAVGRICDALQKRGLWDTTAIVFTSDHGDYLGDHDRLRKGYGACDALLHVPFLLRVPWRDLPARIDRTMSNVDVMPTLLSAAGIAPPALSQGRNILDPPEAGEPARAFACCSGPSRETINLTVYDDRGRYTCYPHTGREELFDHHADPGEYRNLAADPAQAARRAELHAELRAFLFRSWRPCVGRVSAW
jgi:arylsulfatase A-like enzyme